MHYRSGTPLHCYLNCSCCYVALLYQAAFIEVFYIVPLMSAFIVHRFGSTPLHRAAYFGHIGCAKVLLEAGAMVNVEESWGQTPLFLAAQRAHRY